MTTTSSSVINHTNNHHNKQKNHNNDNEDIEMKTTTTILHHSYQQSHHTSSSSSASSSSSTTTLTHHTKQADESDKKANEDNGELTLPFTWTYSSLKQMTTKPLVEVLFTDCRSCWWLLVLTGMVWGTESMWQGLGDTVIGLDSDGHLHYDVKKTFPSSPAAAPPLSTSVSSPSISSSTPPPLPPASPVSPAYLYHITITSRHKQYFFRGWYLLIQLIIITSMILIISFAIKRELDHAMHDDAVKQYDIQFEIFYLTMLIQAVTTFITTRLMIQRIHSFAPLYTIQYYRHTLPYCLVFFLFSMGLELLCIIVLNPSAFFIALSNYTLLACLMFILVDIKSSHGLMNHLIDKLTVYQEVYKKKNNATITSTSSSSSSSLGQCQNDLNDPSQQQSSTLPIVSNSSYSTSTSSPSSSIVSHNPLILSCQATTTPYCSLDQQQTGTITFDEYELIRKEIEQRVQESWYINTFAVSVAALNVLNLAIGAFSYLPLFDGFNQSAVIIQLSKEIIFLLLVFIDCANFNAKVDVFFNQLGNYVSKYEKPLYIWLYASLNPISFKLGGYVVTWNRIIIQIVSLVVGVVFGILKKSIVNQ